MACNRLRSLNEVDLLPQLQELNVRSNQLVFVRPLSNMPRLRKLFLAENQLTTLEAIQGVLGHAELIGKRWSFSQFETSTHYENLELSLAGNSLLHLHLAEEYVVENLPNLYVFLDVMYSIDSIYNCIGIVQNDFQWGNGDSIYKISSISSIWY